MRSWSEVRECVLCGNANNRFGNAKYCKKCAEIVAVKQRKEAMQRWNVKVIMIRQQTQIIQPQIQQLPKVVESVVLVQKNHA